MEALNPHRQGEAAKSTDEVFCLAPEEDADSTTTDSGDDASEHIEASERLSRGVHGVQDAELKDEGKTDN